DTEGPRVRSRHLDQSGFDQNRRRRAVQLLDELPDLHEVLRNVSHDEGVRPLIDGQGATWREHAAGPDLPLLPAPLRVQPGCHAGTGDGLLDTLLVDGDRAVALTEEHRRLDLLDADVSVLELEDLLDRRNQPRLELPPLDLEVLAGQGSLPLLV